MTIGFDRKIRSNWLDLTARLAAEGLTPSGIRDRLHEALEGEVSGDTPHTARGKTKTVLLHIWVTVPRGVVPLRDEALAIVGSGGMADLRPLHWGMCLATYPFFRDVAAITGRLLALQDSVTLAMVTRRIVESWGARSTVLRASQRIVRSMVEWGVLNEADGRGVFRRGPRVEIPGDGPCAGWLIEAALIASTNKSIRIGSLLRGPTLFPFRDFATVRDAMDRDRLEVFGKGGGEDVVEMKYTPTADR